jgi:hypothetical protein
VKALTLTQPWATLVAIGAKTIETRGWTTSYRGPLAIHAAKGAPREASALVFNNDVFMDPLRAAGFLKVNQIPMRDLPLGAVVAICQLVHVFPTDHHAIEALCRERPRERLFGHYAPGRHAFVLTEIRMLPKPVPARGALNLWDWDPSAHLEGIPT